MNQERHSSGGEDQDKEIDYYGLLNLP